MSAMVIMWLASLPRARRERKHVHWHTGYVELQLRAAEGAHAQERLQYQEDLRPAVGALSLLNESRSESSRVVLLFSVGLLDD